MIHIEKDQNIVENENLRVSTSTGDYEDGALVEFYNIDSPDVVVGTFQAQYIKYGGMVYTFGGHKELGEAILKIDPESTHTAASYVRMSNQLLAQMEGGSLEPDSLDQVLSEEQTKMEDKIENPPETPTEEVESEDAPPEEIPVEENTEETEIIDVPVDEIIPEELPIEETIIEEEMLPTPEEVVPTPVPEVIPEIIPEVVPETILETEPVTMLKGKARRIIG